MKNIGQPKYGLVDSGIFGVKIVAGIVTGLSFTEDKPVYELSFGKDKWRTSEIADSPEQLLKLMKLAPLERIRETHGLKIKYEPPHFL